MAREAMGVCLRVLKESNKSRFDSYSVRKSVLIISHITFRDCRVHSFSDNLSRNSCISQNFKLTVHSSQMYVETSLRTADVFPVVACLPPKNNEWRFFSVRLSKKSFVGFHMARSLRFTFHVYKKKRCQSPYENCFTANCWTLQIKRERFPFVTTCHAR